MNIEQANGLPIAQILEKITSGRPKKIGDEYAYLAPWRNEKEASLHINPRKNAWFDHGEGKGGDVVSLVCHHLRMSGEPSTCSDALRWIANMTSTMPRIQPIVIEEAPTPKKLSISKIVPIRYQALNDYLKSRGIPIGLAGLYLREVWLYNQETGKTSFALGHKNDNGSYELRNPYMKICLKKKGLTFIRGQNVKPDGIHLFEGMMDYLSVLACRDLKHLDDDAIVFNSLSMMDEATPVQSAILLVAAVAFQEQEPDPTIGTLTPVSLLEIH